MTTNPETAGVEPVALKECPFCGGAALRKPDPGRLNEMFGLVVDHKPGCFLGFRGIETDGAIDAAWNTRAHPAPASNTTPAVESESADRGAEVVERVAKAIEKYERDPQLIKRHSWRNWQGHARAALAAIRSGSDG